MVPIFFEAFAFHLLEQRILRNDPNEFKAFLDKFKEDNDPEKIDLNLFKTKKSDVEEIFNIMVKFLENIYDTFLNSASNRQETLRIAIQTLEDCNNRTMFGLGLFFKANMISFAGKLKRNYGIPNNVQPKYIASASIENNLLPNEILSDMRIFAEFQSVNICIMSDNGCSCTHHSFNGEIILTFMEFKQTYLIIYDESKLLSQPQPDKHVPLPSSSIEHLIKDNYDGDITPKKYTFTSSKPSYKNDYYDIAINYETQCCICHNELFERAYINPPCQHKFCYNCLVEKTQKQNCSSICYEMRCTKNINLNEVEEYLIEMQTFKDFEIDPGTEKLPCVCTQCQNQDLLSLSLNFIPPEYFTCSQCKDFQCLIHLDSMQNCKCFCEKCKQKFDEFPHIKTIFCKGCQKSFCKMCHQEKKTCQCFCEVCDSRKNKQTGKCDFCEKECIMCHTEYESSSMTLASCGKHLVCRCCFIREISSKDNECDGKECVVCIQVLP